MPLFGGAFLLQVLSLSCFMALILSPSFPLNYFAVNVFAMRDFAKDHGIPIRKDGKYLTKPELARAIDLHFQSL